MDNEPPTFLNGLSKLWTPIYQFLYNTWYTWFPRKPEEYDRQLFIGTGNIDRYRQWIHRFAKPLRSKESVPPEQEKHAIENIAGNILQAELFGVSSRSTLMQDVPESYRERVAAMLADENIQQEIRQFKAMIDQLEAQFPHPQDGMPRSFPMPPSWTR